MHWHCNVAGARCIRSSSCFSHSASVSGAALGVHPFNHDHCRFLTNPHLVKPTETTWYFLISVTKVQVNPPHSSGNPCRGGILSQYFSPTDILLQRFGGKIWKRHSEGGDKWQVIHIKGLKQNRYFLPSRWSLIKTLEIPKEIRADCATLNFTSSYCASTSPLLQCASSALNCFSLNAHLNV